MKVAELSEELFDSYKNKYRSRSFRFEDSWLYIIQACRENGQIVQHNDSIACIADRSKTNDVVLVNHFGDLRDLSRIAQAVKKDDGRVIHKNVNPQDLSYLVSEGFRPYVVNENWDGRSRFDDQTYPQQVINLEEFYEMAGFNYKCIRRDLKIAKRKFNLTSESYMPQKHKLIVEELSKKQDILIPGSHDAQKMYLDLVSDDNKHFSVHKINDVIKGFTCIGKISNDCCSANGLIYDTELKGFTALLYFEVVRIAKNAGFNFINFQGSENKNLDSWKRKFNPMMSIRNTHLVYEG